MRNGEKLKLWERKFAPARYAGVRPLATVVFCFVQVALPSVLIFDGVNSHNELSRVEQEPA